MIDKNNNSKLKKGYGKIKPLGTAKKRYVRVENIQYKSLSNEQIEVMNYLCNDFLTVPEIASKRQTKIFAVYKTIAKLKMKGVIIGRAKVKTKGTAKPTAKRGGDSNHNYKLPSRIKDLRLHAQSFQIEILEPSSFYIKLLKKKNRDELDSNTLMLHKNNITIYFNKDFWATTVDNCLKDSLDYTNRFISKLENHYKIILKKGLRCNIREFRGEIARINDPLAKEVNISEEKFVVYDSNGVKRLIVDKSFKFNELETVSKYYAKDMRRVERYYKSLLEMESEPMTPEQILKSLSLQTKVNSNFDEYKNESLIMLRGLIESNKMLTAEIIELKKKW